MFTLKNKITPYYGAALLALGSTALKISYLFGSFALFFSGINIIAPVAGLFGPAYSSLVFFSIIALIKLLFFGLIPKTLMSKGIITFCALLLFKLHLPTVCASLGLRTNHWFFHIVLPALCMFLFTLHPVGRLATPYSFYWFIPMIIYATQRKDLFSRALASTFIAHAIGSVLWIYCKITTPALWISLLPVVIFERILFAAGITLIYSCINALIKIPSLSRGYEIVCLKTK